MADISMCRNHNCIAKDCCYRQRATPHPKRQSFGSFKPNNNEIGEAFDCDHFYAMQENWFRQQTYNPK
jgi:hypothetical protein